MVRRVEFSALIRTIGGAPVLEVSGEIDMATVDRFRAALREATSRNDRGLLVVDLTGVKFMGVEGSRAIFESTRRFRNGGGEVKVVAKPAEEVELALRLMGMDRYFAIYPDVFSAANDG